MAGVSRQTPGDTPTPLGVPRRDLPAAHETTEVRRFAGGPPPSDVRTWFGVSADDREERCDRYLVDQVADVGIKERGGQTLELKVRRSVGPSIDLGRGLRGTLEDWSKWSPADDVIDIPEQARCVSVINEVSKRRFAVAGAELPVAAEPVAGCDVEVTHVMASGHVQAWSLADAAFGPEMTRRRALHAAWRTLTKSGPVPAAIVHRLGGSMGYPQWLSQTIPIALVLASAPAMPACQESTT